MSRARVRTVVEVSAIAGVLAAVVWLGLLAQGFVWRYTDTIRYVPDMQNAWDWGSRAAAEGYVGLYDRVVAETPDREYGLDYMPLRLGVMTLWAQSRLAIDPATDGWRRDEAFNRPLMTFNAACELAAAFGVFALAWDWRRRDRADAGPAGARPLHGVWPAVAAFTLAWLNPASLISAHGRPTWDVWVLPFYVWAVFSAGRGAWLTAGCVVGVGVMFKGQQLFAVPLLVLWPLMRGRVGALARFCTGLFVSVALLAWSWLVGRSAGATLFVVGLGLVPALLWLALRQWPVRGLRVPGRWVAWTTPAVVAGAIAACGPLFGGSYNWLRVGLIYGADKFDALAVDRTYSLAAILQRLYRWRPNDRVESLQWVYNGLTVSHLLVAIYAACVLLIAWAAARYDKRGDRRFVLTVAAVWVVWFAVFPRMHERYLLWGAVFACTAACAHGGAVALAVFFSLASFCMSLSQMCFDGRGFRFLSEVAPGTGWTVMRLLGPLYPGMAFAVVLAAAVWLWITVAGAFERRSGLARPPVSSSMPDFPAPD